MPPQEYDFEVIREGGEKILKINLDRASYPPSIEDSEKCMRDVISLLVKVIGVTKFVLVQRRDYEYDHNQTIILNEIANLIKKVGREQKYTYTYLLKRKSWERYIKEYFTQMQYILNEEIKKNPIFAYISLKRLYRSLKVRITKSNDIIEKDSLTHIAATINYTLNIMSEWRLIILTKKDISKHKRGNREIYRSIFHPFIKPNFMYTKLMVKYPENGIIVDNYTIGNAEVTIFQFPDSAKTLYHLIPPEFKLSEEKYVLLEEARKIMAEHRPSKEEYLDPDLMREVFFNVGKDLLDDLAKNKNIEIIQNEIDELAEILLRYTVGFGLIEILLSDTKVQDANINSPPGTTPIYLVHGDYDDCYTNIIPTRTEVDGWATKLRLISGRPLDEANPVLDTELEIKKMRSRVSAVAPPLNPKGLAFSFRRHRDKPWTLPLFIKVGMINSMAAGLLSFLIDGTRTMLIGGTRSSGKTSLLGSLMIEIMRRYRMITIEDSVSENSRVLVSYDDKKYNLPVKKIFNILSGKNKVEKINSREIIRPNKLFINSINKNGKLECKKALSIIRHKVKKTLYEIITRTGRKLEITGDHSIFVLSENTKRLLKEEKISNLKLRDRVAVPRKLIISKNPKKFNLYDVLKNKKLTKNEIDKMFLVLKDKTIEKNKKIIKKLGRENYCKSTVNKWIKDRLIPFKIADRLNVKNSDITYLRYGKNAKNIRFNIKLDNEFVEFIGLWVADGCYDRNSIIMSVSSKEEQELVKKISKRFGFNIKTHSDKFSLMINSKSFRFIMKHLLDLDGNAYTKKIPWWVYSLSDKLKASFMRGFFSGDGCVSDKEIITSLASMNLLEDIQTLLLNWGIIFRINRLRKRKSKDNDRTKDGRISSQESIDKFKKYIGFLQEYKNKKLNILSKRKSTHASSDSVKLDKTILNKLKSICPKKIFNSQDYITRNNKIGINKLDKIADYLIDKKNELGKYLKKISNSDIFWDEIVSIKKLKNKQNWVYDFSVPENENFISDNILAHNTLELPTDSLMKLGYNIQPLKVASALAGKESSEVSATIGIRTTLRLGDSALIVGEVRSSLRGDQEVVIIEKGITRRTAIKNIEGKDLKNVYLPTLTNENKMELKPISGFIKHPKSSKLIKLTTKSGRSVIVTPDHSVFTHVDFKIAAINTNQLMSDDPIIIPSKIPCGFKNFDSINLLEIFKENYRVENAEPYIRKAIKILNWKKASKICKIPDIYRYLLSTQKTRIPIKSFLKLMKRAKIKYNLEDLRIKRGTSNSIPAKFPINENILRLIGYYLAEGNIDNNKIQITNSKPKIIEDIKYICQKELGLQVSQRKIKGLGSSVQIFIMSKPLIDLLLYFGCGKTSLHKRIPEFVYGLNKNKICALLKGMYSGDGSISSLKKCGNIIRYYSTSKKLVEDVNYALLTQGIVCKLIERMPNKKENRKYYIAEIKLRKYIKYFLENIGFTHKKPKIISNSFSHSKNDSVVFNPKELEKNVVLPRKYRHLRKTKCCSKNYLKKLTEEVKCTDELYDFAHGDFFIDRIKSIETINLHKPEYVYDLSVKSTQRFIGGSGSILLHNSEAKSLYEAMRVGAAANVVAGTIHGDSPYGVFDRVVNDIGVPKTSFKATDIIVISNPVKSAAGLKKKRRVLKITEVRKKWTDDPMREKGFVDLMKYNSITDQLEITDELSSGDSEVLKLIASNISDFAGNWNAVWENIQLRAKCKEEIVKLSDKLKNPDLLEADFVLRCNDYFHKTIDKIKKDKGFIDNERVFFEYKELIKKEAKKYG